MEKVSKGRFSLRDMYKQFHNLMKIGPINKVMYMMDSMTDKELDGKVDLHNKKGDDNTIETRIRRIARGSGTHPNEVKQLLQCHRQFEGMVSKMGKTGMIKSTGGAGRQKQITEHVRKNPGSIINHLNNINPNILKQIGV